MSIDNLSFNFIILHRVFDNIDAKYTIYNVSFVNGFNDFQRFWFLMVGTALVNNFCYILNKRTS